LFPLRSILKVLLCVSALKADILLHSMLCSLHGRRQVPPGYL
jgi:hypothetical protein